MNQGAEKQDAHRLGEFCERRDKVRAQFICVDSGV
jgi:hypothetical protein